MKMRLRRFNVHMLEKMRMSDIQKGLEFSESKSTYVSIIHKQTQDESHIKAIECQLSYMSISVQGITNFIF